MKQPESAKARPAPEAPPSPAPPTESSARISEPIRAVVQLFAGPLAEVRFPDADHQRLVAQVREVERLGGELHEALAAVQQARAELDDAQAELHELARRALAYARIFADNDDELRTVVEGISLGTQAVAPKRKRGRPRKHKDGEGQTTLVVANDDAA